MKQFKYTLLLCLCVLEVIAQHDGNKTLLIFSGSDWCAPCIRFQRDVLSQPEFLAPANSRLHVLIADFPQRKVLPDSVVKRNEALAERYNMEGAFPKILLLDEEGRVMYTLHYSNETADVFLQQLKQMTQ